MAAADCMLSFDHLLQVAARAEGLVTRAGENRDTQGGVALEAVPCVKEALAYLLAEGIAGLGSIRA